MRNRSVLALAILAVFLSACSTVGVFGAQSLGMLEQPVGGRPFTYSPSDAFYCVDRSGGGDVYRVPYLYASDQSSIPPAALPIIDLLGRGGRLNPQFSRAAVLHDFMYAIGTPGDREAQEAADEIFFLLQRQEGVRGPVVVTMEWIFAVVRNTDPPRNPFGHDVEWRRWANPQTLFFATPDRRPLKQYARALVTTLPSCATFDRVRTRQSKRLHACLHVRHMSTLDTGFWPVARQFPAKPAIPAPLAAFAGPADRAAYMAGSCSRYH